jgi:hypothetical protein
MPKVRNSAAAIVLASAAGLNAGAWLYGTAQPVVGFGEGAIERWSVVSDLCLAAGMLAGGLFLVHLPRLWLVALAAVLVAACGQFGIAAGASGAFGEAALLACGAAVGLGSGLASVTYLRLLSAGAAASGKTLGFAFAASCSGYLTSRWIWGVAEAVGAGSRLDATRPVALACGATTVVLGAVAVLLILGRRTGSAEQEARLPREPRRGSAMAAAATVAVAFAGLAWVALGGVHADAVLRFADPVPGGKVPLARMAVPLVWDVLCIAAPIAAAFIWRRLARWRMVAMLGLVMMSFTISLGAGSDAVALGAAICAGIVSSFLDIALIVVVWRASGERLLHWIGPAMAAVALAGPLFSPLPPRGYHWIVIACAGWAVVALAGVLLGRFRKDLSEGGAS